MKKFVSKVILIPAVAMLLASCSDFPIKKPEIDDGWDGDPISYVEKDDRVDYDHPSMLFNDKSEGEAAIVEPSKIIIHYHNDDMAVKNRRFYTWVTGVDGEERKPDSSTETDMYITIDFETYPEYKDTPSFFFIIKVAGTWAGQSQDIEIPYDAWQDKIIENQGVLELWSIPGEGNSVEVYGSEAETKFPKLKTAKFIDWKTIECVASDEPPMYYNLYAFDKNYLMGTPQQQIANKQFHLFKSGSGAECSSSTFRIRFNYTAKINVQYVIETEYASNPGRIQKVIVTSENLYENDRFEQFYTTDITDLGCTYHKGATEEDTYTTFKVWAPTAAIMYVKVYSNGTPKNLGGSDSSRSYIMTYQPGGVWSCTITGKDLAGSFYTYTVTNSGGTNETIDPYAKSCGLNGVRGAIYDKDAPEANPDDLQGWNALKGKWQKDPRYTINSPQDMSIYEVHVRDLTIDETWGGTKTPGTYEAFYESGTTYSEGGKTVTTGFDHIKELGVKGVQLLPVFDGDNDERPEKIKYNWGYNPLNYNCVEGGYSSDPTNPLARVKEFKSLVYNYATQGDDSTRVIMDVVYNHMASATNSSFQKLMPKYYFRYDENWNFYDGSGCNNEVKTDATMMRKFIVESLCWWASEYQIKGFRFDLMGLIDSWTLKEAGKALYAIDPSIMLYGEGWTSGGYHGAYELDGDGNLINGGAETPLCYQQLYPDTGRIGVGAFNDAFRSAIKGANDDGWNNNPYPQYGFINQGSGDVGEKSTIIADGMMGMHTNKGGNPSQTINYASCHDNYTVWDQLRYTLATKGYRDNHSPMPGGEPNVYDKVKATLAVHAEVMMSNGVGFMQGGEELYRSKEYDSASLAELRAKGTVKTYPSYPHYVDPTTNPDAEIATDDVELFDVDQVITHNSYKAPDCVNSFKWNRKISLEGEDMMWAFDVWKQIIKTRKQKQNYSWDEMSSSSEYINSWNTFGGSSVMATWLNNSRDPSNPNVGYYFIFAGRDGGYLPIDTKDIKAENLVFTNYDGGINNTDGGVNVAPYTFACYKKGF